jgi:hypothetical protein
MGHGAARDHNPARTGLELSVGDVLTAHELPGIRTCRRVVLSCCVLGQTREVIGEPLGFLASSFGYECSFGSGWLTEVPDAMACLFSLAFQFSVRAALRGDHREVAWGDSFESTRQAIFNSRWPDGYGEWLAEHLPAALPDGAARPAGDLRRAPPQQLRDMMPWAVCLGR